MFTLASARSAIGNPAQFARGGAYVQEGRVSGVTIREERGLQVYEGVVHAPDGDLCAMFEYDEAKDVFAGCRCACAEIGRSVWGCRHVAALMVAACGGAGTRVGARSGQEMMDALLEDTRLHPVARRIVRRDEPVRLYPALRRVSCRQIALSLKIGRTRPYVVRSMAELAERAKKREKTMYGRELTFSHSEDELVPADAALFGQIVMLASGSAASGGELLLEGAALDQMMRLLDGHETEIREGNGTIRRAMVTRGELTLDVELEGSEETGAQMQVKAGDVVWGQNGAYRFLPEQITCAFGAAYDRLAGLLRIADEYPEGIRFDGAQLGEVCTRLILPAGTGALVTKGQAIVAAHTPTPMVPKLYVDTDDTGRLICRIGYNYLGTEIFGTGEHPHIRRDTVLEEDVREQTALMFPEKTAEDEYVFDGGDDEQFDLLANRLQDLESLGEVHVSKRLTKKHVTRPRQMSFGLSPQGEKLKLQADLGGYTQEELTAALAAYRQKREYVRLESGVFLSGEALEQAADAAQVLEGVDVTAEQAQEGVEVPRSRAMYLDAALENRENMTLNAPEEITQWTERLRTAQKTTVTQPAGLKAQLRSYQATGLSWLCALEASGFGGILADDMGLGKTIQALAMLLCAQERGERVRALVVCPASLQLNWLAEAQRFAPSLTCMSLEGPAKNRAEAIADDDVAQLLITSYDQLRRDVQVYQDETFTHVLLDEAQNIKNAASQAARAVKTIRAEHRFAMTGTPIENRLSEFWSIFDFLMPGYLGSYKQFKERFEAPVVRDADERARENLHMLAAPFILRRMKKDVLDDLPEKVETVMTSDMTEEQRRLYAAYASQLKSESGILDKAGQAHIRMLAGLTRLRQLCCDPRLCLENYAGGSGKFTQMLEVVREAISGGHKILLFSQFTSMLDLIAEAFSAEGISCFMLKGDTEKETRMDLVKRFNAGEADVFLISLKAGGTGLNLTGADVVIHYDPWWNVSAQNQATDRAYRIGQTKGVQVIYLIASGTVEEYILTLQEQKKALGDGVLSGGEDLFTVDTDLLREVLGSI